MRRIFVACGLLLSIAGCGVEGLGTAATAAKLQADQAKQGKETMDALKANIDAANQKAADSASRAEGAGKP
jgi:hypothetical protein